MRPLRMCICVNLVWTCRGRAPPAPVRDPAVSGQGQTPGSTISRQISNRAIEIMRKFRSIPSQALLLSALLLMACGCAPIEVRESRKLDAFLLASKGAPPAEMARKLASQGYACTTAPELPSSTNAALQCSSQKSNLWPPYACIFRVELEAESQVGSNDTPAVVSHTCAGL